MSANVRQRLQDAGFELPAVPVALGDYVPASRAGDLVFTSGQLPVRDGELLSPGTVGLSVDPADAREAAATAALNALAAAATVCDLDEVFSAVKLVGYVASAADFVGQPGVIDAASAVLVAAFGDVGAHAREAVGVSALPRGSCVEVSLVLYLG